VSLTSKSVALLALAGLLSVLVLLDPGPGGGDAPDAVVLASVSPSDIQRIEITQATQRTVLKHNPKTDRWAITAPIGQAADSIRVNHLLSVFRREIVADAQIDAGKPAEYGLDASNGILVELFASDALPAVSLTIGNDVSGGASLVRKSGENTVYRARLGGRARYDRRPADWRNRVVLDFAEPDTQGVSIEPNSGASVHLVRSPTPENNGDGVWVAESDPGWSMDSDQLQALVANLGRMRAANILSDEFNGGFSPPRANITVVDKDGIETVMAIGSREEQGAAFVRVENKDGVFAVDLRVLKPLLQGAAEVLDLTMFRVPPEQMDKLIFYQGRTQVELSRHPETRVWGVSRPSGMVVDVAQIQYAVNLLGAPKADKEGGVLADARTGLGRPKMVFEVQKTDGSHEALYVGKHFKNGEGEIFFHVKRQGDPGSYLLSEGTLTRLRAAFGQG
jgi:hypothetical protein